MPFDADSANDDAPPAADRRNQARRRVLLSGKLAFADANLTADCSVRNLSETGAMVALPPILLPSQPFLIVIKDAFLHETNMVWRRDGRAGLRFQASWRLTGGTPERLGPYRALWLQLLAH